ncbi:MAG: tetratricopeptide repeat protein [Desulfarculus sp.]|nr:tetratricopeptide repeat protein [Desulfarculus sp.]
MSALQPQGGAGQSSGRAPRRPPGQELAAFCLLKLGRPQEALARLEGEPGQQGYAAYLRGLALANLGRLDEAVGCLRQPGLPAALAQASRQDLLTLLRLQVRARLAAQDYLGASEALGQALEVAPQDQELLRLQAELGQRMPVVFLHSGRRPQAQQTWEAAQRQDPANPEPTHCLALCYYWQARQLEEAGDQAAGQAWRGAIRNWVALVHHQGFWQGLVQGRAGIYGELPEAELTALRERLRDDLGRELARFQNQYQDQGRRDQASRLSGLALELSAEIRSAEALQHVVRSLARQGVQFRQPPPGGFMMVEHLGLSQDLQGLLNLVQTTQTNLESTEDLNWCLTGYLLPWTLLREGRHLEALQMLESTVSGPMPEPARRLMVMAQVGQAERLAKANEVEQALETLEKAAKLAAEGSGGEMVRGTLEKIAIREANRLQGQGQFDQACQFLERCLKLGHNKRLKEYLSEALNRKANKVAGDAKDRFKVGTTEFKEVERLLDRALEADPNNNAAAENKACMLLMQAAEVAQAGNPNRAIEYIKRAHSVAPNSPQVKQFMAAAGLR